MDGGQPVVGVIAIIVALYVSHRSSKETKKQIDAVYNLLDVFVAAQNPAMMEAKRKYEQQLAELDYQMQELSEDIQTDNFPLPGGPKIHIAGVMEEKIRKMEQLEVLEDKRMESQEYLDLIQSYLSKTKH
ncbi:MAG: hypothetical protein J6W30_02040 [Bacteroidales bacterium]|nr:hypothetical protein [Bacteroidales bacterium]